VIFLSLKETALGQNFIQSENAFDIYATLSKNYDYFDSNFEYKSEFAGKKYVLKTILPLDHHQLLKQSPASIQRLMRYRHILLAWFPYLAGMRPLFPKTELVEDSGVLEARYEFDLSKSIKQPSKFQVV